MDKIVAQRQMAEEGNKLLVTAFSHFQAGIDEVALPYCEAALRLAPGRADAWSLLGILYRRAGKLEQAVQAQQQAAICKWDYPDAYSNMGNALRGLRRIREAIVAYRQALCVRPDWPEIYNVLSDIYRETDHPEIAIQICQYALRINPKYAEGYSHLGNGYLGRNDYEQAIISYRYATMFEPKLAEAHYNMGNACQHQALIPEAVHSYQRALCIKPDFVKAHSNMLFTLQYDPQQTLESIHYAHQGWWYARERELRRSGYTYPVYRNSRDPNRPLKIGFVSADLGRHPVGIFLTPFAQYYDKNQFQTYYYSAGTHQDEVTEHLKKNSQSWHSIIGVEDAAVAAMIQSDQIDILFDLAGHTAGNRLMVFALKPAPIQITWGGYVGTTGLKTMDYLLSDAKETPPGVDRWYTERIIRMPDDYVCYTAPPYSPEVTPLPALQNGYVTFGCFNNMPKVNPGVVATWAEILKALPRARLRLMTSALGDLSIRNRYLHLFEKAGIHPDRVECQGRVSHQEMLTAYTKIDLALDPFPYSGGLTTLESVWMGVPVITLGGDRFCSRHSVSHLTASGIPEFIAENQNAYVQKAVDWANHLERLASVRAGLREKMQQSPACDGQRYTRNLEAALRQVWQDWCRSGAVVFS